MIKPDWHEDHLQLRAREVEPHYKSLPEVCLDVVAKDSGFECRVYMSADEAHEFARQLDLAATSSQARRMEDNEKE